MLFENAGSENKKFIKILNAGHNTIFTFGLDEYFSSIKSVLFSE